MIKSCEKKVERINKQILKQKQVILDLNKKIQQFKNEIKTLKRRNLKGGMHSWVGTLLERLPHDVRTSKYLSQELLFSNMTTQTPKQTEGVVENIKTNIMKSYNKYDDKFFISTIMNFVNVAINSEKEKIAIDLFKFYIEHNMNNRSEMFDTIFEKIQPKSRSMIAFVEYIIKRRDCFIIEDYHLGDIIIQSATSHGRYDIINLMIKHKRYFDIVNCIESIIKGRPKSDNIIMEYLRYLYKKLNHDDGIYGTKYAAVDEYLRYAQLEYFKSSLKILGITNDAITKWAKSIKIDDKDVDVYYKNYELSPKMIMDNKNLVDKEFLLAVEERNVDKASALLKLPNRITKSSYKYCNIAADNGDLPMLKLLISKNFSLNVLAYGFAARGGHLNILQSDLMPKNIYKLNTDICAFAAGGGHLDVLKWAHKENFSWNESTCANAAGGGHLAVLQWARGAGCPWNESTCTFAAGYGRLAVLQWAHENGCRWDENTCTAAAKNGHLDVLKWARSNGCDWDEETSEITAKNGHLAVLKWARSNGCPWDESNMCSYAAEGGHLEVLKWVHSQGCPWTDKTCELAAKKGHLAILQWAHANDCPWYEETCAAAAKNGHLAILQWALSNGCAWNEKKVMQNILAKKRYFLYFLKWYHNKEPNIFKKYWLEGEKNMDIALWVHQLVEDTDEDSHEDSDEDSDEDSHED